MNDQAQATGLRSAGLRVTAPWLPVLGALDELDAMVIGATLLRRPEL